MQDTLKNILFICLAAIFSILAVGIPVSSHQCFHQNTYNVTLFNFDKENTRCMCHQDKNCHKNTSCYQKTSLKNNENTPEEFSCCNDVSNFFQLPPFTGKINITISHFISFQFIYFFADKLNHIADNSPTTKKYRFKIPPPDILVFQQLDNFCQVLL